MHIKIIFYYDEQILNTAEKLNVKIDILDHMTGIHVKKNENNVRNDLILEIINV